MDESWVNESSPWIDYSLENWKLLTNGRTPVSYKKKCFLYHQEDDAPRAYIVKSGRVRLTLFSADGTEKQLYIAGPGCLFGEIACIMGLPHTESALCVHDTQVYQIPQNELINTMQNNWEINKRVYNSVFRKNTVYHHQILELCFLSCVQRIAIHLLDLCKRHGVKVKEGYKLDLRFTHSDIASMIHTSRVTVNNTFTWLIQNDYLVKTGQTYLIPYEQIERLQQLAEEVPL